VAKYRKDITVGVINPTSKQLDSNQFFFSGVIVFNGEQLARMTREGCAVRYELFNVRDAEAKWARVVRHSEEMLAGAFAPLDEFLGMLLADAISNSETHKVSTGTRLSGYVSQITSKLHLISRGLLRYFMY